MPRFRFLRFSFHFLFAAIALFFSSLLMRFRVLITLSSSCFIMLPIIDIFSFFDAISLFHFHFFLFATIIIDDISLSLSLIFHFLDAFAALRAISSIFALITLRFD